MTQISRPFQIGLLAVALFAAVWFLALRGHSSSGGSSGSAAPSAASSAPASSSAAGGGTPASTATTYHGSAPGVAGLTRAIDKARGAVTQSQQNAKQLQQQAQQASSQAQQASSSSNAQSQSASSASAKTAPSSAKVAPKSTSAPSSHKSETALQTDNGVPVMQAAVEGELKQGKVVAVLFWDPKGSVDSAVRRELQAAHRALHRKLAIHLARSNQVSSFGSFTHAVQVYATPTILIINKEGKTASITGLTDAFSLEQAIKEVKRAK